MKIILLQDVENIGKKYDVKEVADGYARNFLIPKGLAKQADEKSLKWFEIQKEIQEKKAETDLKKIQESASKLDDFEIIITTRVGENEQLFESINVQKISEKLKEAGFDIKKSQIELKEPIKELGEFPIKIKLEHNLEVEIMVVVVKLEEEK